MESQFYYHYWNLGNKGESMQTFVKKCVMNGPMLTKSEPNTLLKSKVH